MFLIINPTQIMKKPTVDDQKSLIEIDSQKYEVVNIPRTNKKVKIGWMKPRTFECVSKLMLDSGFEDNREYVPVNDKEIKRYSTFVSKYAALVILNGIKINLFYHIIIIIIIVSIPPNQPAFNAISAAIEYKIKGIKIIVVKKVTL